MTIYDSAEGAIVFDGTCTLTLTKNFYAIKADVSKTNMKIQNFNIHAITGDKINATIAAIRFIWGKQCPQNL